MHFPDICIIIDVYSCCNPRLGVRSAKDLVKIELMPGLEMVHHFGRQFPPFSVILTNKHRQIWIQSRKIVQVQQNKEIFSEANDSLEASWDLVLESIENFDQNHSSLHSWRQRMFNKKFALEKTYQIVSGVPQTL